MNKLIVTRHPALRELLIGKGLVSSDVPILEHATREDVKGKKVFGVLPLALACEAQSITEISLNVPLELRGKELDLATLRRIAGEITTFRVIKEEKKDVTVKEMADILFAGHSVICRQAARGRLTGELKKRKIFTSQKTLNDFERTVLFSPCEKRKFKD